jgi:hypothetical protein
MDLGHPSVAAYALEIGVSREQLLFGTREHGRHGHDAKPGDAVRAAHLTFPAFARLAGATSAEIATAAHGELTEALTADGRIDIGHQAVLAYLAGRPIRKGEKLDGVLESASVGEQLDVNHPRARAMLARSWGRVPRDADLDDALAARK